MIIMFSVKARIINTVKHLLMTSVIYAGIFENCTYQAESSKFPKRDMGKSVNVTYSFAELIINDAFLNFYPGK